jgi:hypothetical protein
MDNSTLQRLKDFALVYNDTEGFPTISDVAAKLGKAPSTVRHTAAEYRRIQPLSVELEPLISRVGSLMPFQHQLGDDVPMSEDESKFHPEFTAQDCINTLREFALADPDRVISRNNFRVHGPISESTWNRFFGTFEEFKRQAGIKLTRQQHGLERAIAKHASVDHYRRMNIERGDYAERYIREAPTRFKTRIFCSDLHDEEMDPFYRRVLIDTVKRVRPDSFTIVGDGLDLPEFGKYSVDPREWGPVRRINKFHIFCADIREVFEGQFDFVEGNHEFRLLRHLGDETPALKTVLAELHGMDIRKLLGLDRFEINYIAKADLAAFREKDIQLEVGKNYKIYDNAFMAHHFPHARDMNMPGCNGHHHNHTVWPHFNPMFGAYEWHQMGCGHKRDASYCAGEKWHMGFLIAHIDTRTRQVVSEYIQVTDFACVGGKFYHREPNEQTGAPSFTL